MIPGETGSFQLDTQIFYFFFLSAGRHKIKYKNFMSGLLNKLISCFPIVWKIHYKLTQDTIKSHFQFL